MFMSVVLISVMASEPAATVNGEAIPLSRVDDYIRTKLAILPASASQSRQLRNEVLNDLIDDALLKQFLHTNAPKVEAAELDQKPIASLSTPRAASLLAANGPIQLVVDGRLAR